MADQTVDPKADPTGTYSPDAAAFQPSAFLDPSKFASSELYWWNNGIWGEAGYAIPNDGGKPTTPNETIRDIHQFLGRELFSLMHRADVRFTRPFNGEWLFDLNKMLQLGIKRMSDLSIGWTDNREGDGIRVTNTPEAFKVYPVPYFGNRIRQGDARKWCNQILRLLGEIMQHSDNEYDDNITAFLAAEVTEDLNRIRKDLAMKYLGMSREAVEAPTFAIPADAFSGENYRPDDLFTSSEMIEERMPEQWWPTANDLTPIAGIPAPIAKVWATRWPDAGNFYGDGGAAEAAFPGAHVGLVSKPGSRP